MILRRRKCYFRNPGRLSLTLALDITHFFQAFLKLITFFLPMVGACQVPQTLSSSVAAAVFNLPNPTNLAEDLPLLPMLLSILSVGCSFPFLLQGLFHLHSQSRASLQTGVPLIPLSLAVLFPYCHPYLFQLGTPRCFHFF